MAHPDNSGCILRISFKFWTLKENKEVQENYINGLSEKDIVRGKRDHLEQSKWINSSDYFKSLHKVIKSYIKVILMVFYIKKLVWGNWIVWSPKMIRLCNSGSALTILDKLSWLFACWYKLRKTNFPGQMWAWSSRSWYLKSTESQE